jgi:aminoglycoside/choline kinase family phosphotransferase
MNNNTHRLEMLNHWLTNYFGNANYHLTPLAGDASFRRYYRLNHQNTSYIIMDAPPQKENIEPFLQVSNLLSAQGLKIPHAHGINHTEGFIILDDLGDTLLLSVLTAESAPRVYQEAIQQLIHMQNIKTDSLPPFNAAFIHEELTRFIDWYLIRHLDLDLTPTELTLIQQTFELLSTTLVHQPQVFIHRDFHARNIMICPDGQLGIIDYQDAMSGPIAYDLVSLLKDCYIDWPRERYLEWLHGYFIASPFLKPYDFETLTRWFDYCGLQRHLKVYGIFSRLAYRDNKPHYLNELPRIERYVLESLTLYPELSAFKTWFQDKVMTRVTA